MFDLRIFRSELLPVHLVVDLEAKDTIIEELPESASLLLVLVFARNTFIQMCCIAATKNRK